MLIFIRYLIFTYTEFIFILFPLLKSLLILIDNEYINIDDLYEFLNFTNYFEESEIKSIHEKLIKKIKIKNFNKIKLESFILSLFHENLKETAKFLIDFFIRNENNLNNYIEIFSKNLKNITDLNNKFVSKSIIEKDEYEKNGKLRDVNDKSNETPDLKKFFELNFKKNIFTTDIKNQDFKAKIFTKILKSILRSKGLTFIYKLIDLDSFNTLNDSQENNNISKLEKSKFFIN